MNPELNKKIDDVLNSLDDLQQAAVNPFLYTRIRNRMQVKTSSQQVNWKWALALGVMIIANLVTIQYSRNASSISNSEAATLASEYSIIIPDSY
jgi:hypothetical protein